MRLVHSTTGTDLIRTWIKAILHASLLHHRPLFVTAVDNLKGSVIYLVSTRFTNVMDSQLIFERQCSVFF